MLFLLSIIIILVQSGDLGWLFGILGNLAVSDFFN